MVQYNQNLKSDLLPVPVAIKFIHFTSSCDKQLTLHTHLNKCVCHSQDISRYTTFESCNSPFCSSVTGKNEARVDHVLIQPFLLYKVNHVVLLLSSIFKLNLHQKREEVCIKTRSTSASLSLKGWDTKPTTIKCLIAELVSIAAPKQ